MPKVKFIKEKTEIEVPEGANLRAEAVKAGIQVYPGVKQVPQLPRSWNLRNLQGPRQERYGKHGPQDLHGEAHAFQDVFVHRPRERAAALVSVRCAWRHRGRDPAGAQLARREFLGQKPLPETSNLLSKWWFRSLRERTSMRAGRGPSCWRATRHPLAVASGHHLEQPLTCATHVFSGSVAGTKNRQRSRNDAEARRGVRGQFAVGVDPVRPARGDLKRPDRARVRTCLKCCKLPARRAGKSASTCHHRRTSML